MRETNKDRERESEGERERGIRIERGGWRVREDDREAVDLYKFLGQFKKKYFVKNC